VDAFCNTTTMAYDTTYSLYPTSVTNPLNQATSFVWDGTCGVKTSMTDANSQISTMTYDALCRLTNTAMPLSAFESHSYTLTGPTTNKITTCRPPASGTTQICTNEWLDGLGRSYKVDQTGPGTYTIFSWTTFDARGNALAQSLPNYW